MKKVISYIAILGTLTFSSCRHELKSAAYIKYVQAKENGLKKTVVVDSWEYTIQYKPYEYIQLMENRIGNVKDPINNKERLTGTAWFNVSFKRQDGSVSPLRYNLASKEEYDSRINYFLNEAMKGIRLVYNNVDTLRPISYLFENNYNLTPQETFVVGFELPKGNDKPKKDMQLCYNDELFRNGIIKVVYKSEDLNNIPNLIY